MLVRIGLLLLVLLVPLVGAAHVSAQIRYKDSAGVWNWVDSLEEVPPQYRAGAVGSSTPPRPPGQRGPTEWDRLGAQHVREGDWARAVKKCTVTVAKGGRHSKFKAYVSGPRGVETSGGTEDEDYEFGKCMTNAGQPLK